MNKRSTNFSATEVEILLNLVEENKKIIENKKTDNVSTEEKNACWLSIEKAFNASCMGSFRASKILRNKYDNIKRGSKKKFAEERRELYLTGGGKTKASSVSSTDEKIRQICQEEQLVGNKPSYDDDEVDRILKEIQTWSDGDGKEVAAEGVGQEEPCAEQNGTKQNGTAYLNRICIVFCNFCTHAETSSWSQWKPQQMKKPKHTALQNRVRKPTMDSWGAVAEKRAEKIDQEMAFARELPVLQKHKLEMEIEELGLKIAHLKSRDVEEVKLK